MIRKITNGISEGGGREMMLSQLFQRMYFGWENNRYQCGFCCGDDENEEGMTITYYNNDPGLGIAGCCREGDVVDITGNCICLKENPEDCA